MKRLVLTVIGLGLLVSPAFAGEKTSEELREEGNRIFAVEGLRKEQVTRVVASGKGQRIGFYFALNPDCSASGDVEVRVTKEPEHGKADTATVTSYPGYPKENLRFKCNEHKVRGVQINYKSADKYVGDDALDLLVLFPGGYAYEHHYTVSVR